LNSSNGKSFADSGDVSAWVNDAIDWAVSAGILNGKPGNLLEPASVVSRAEVSAMLARFIVWRTIGDNALFGLELRGNINLESKVYTLHLLKEMGLADTLRCKAGFRMRVLIHFREAPAGLKEKQKSHRKT
jgi:hypothetical protein